MIIQLLLTLGLIALSIISWLRVKTIRGVARLFTLISFLGIYFVWAPNNLTRLANFLGVGRGTDLLFYMFLLFVIFELLVVRLREKEKDELMTQLVRKLAIIEAKNDSKN